MPKFKRGEAVRQIMPVPYTGHVHRFSFDETSGEVRVVMRRIETDGTVHEAVFNENQIEIDPKAKLMSAEDMDLHEDVARKLRATTTEIAEPEVVGA